VSSSTSASRLVAFALGAAVLGGLAVGLSRSRASAPAAHRAPDLARGEYLVTKVGMCQDCHTQRGEGGAFRMDRWLHGTSLPFAPTVPMPVWAAAAPRIAGLPGYTDEAAVRFLTTGVTPAGTHARPPMPEFRFDVQDARDVVAYLRSLSAS
jgi:mono/diheme cytochrome c family protein